MYIYIHTVYSTENIKIKRRTHPVSTQAYTGPGGEESRAQ